MTLALLAAGLLAQHHHPGSPASAASLASIDGRVALLEARQMLDSQQLWALRSELPPEALRTLNDVQLHVQHDQEQEDRVRELTTTVASLEQRLATLELALQERAVVEGRIPAAPMQLAPIEVAARPPRDALRAKRGKAAAQKAARKAAARASNDPPPAR